MFVLELAVYRDTKVHIKYVTECRCTVLGISIILIQIESMYYIVDLNYTLRIFLPNSKPIGFAWAHICFSVVFETTNIKPHKVGSRSHTTLPSLHFCQSCENKNRSMLSMQGHSIS